MKNVKLLDAYRDISIGFDVPRIYKPSAWTRAKSVMEWLCDNTKFVYRHDFGRGKGKYDGNDIPGLSFADFKKMLALIYVKHMNGRITAEDVEPLMKDIADELKLPITDKSVVDEFYKRYKFKIS